MNNIVKNNMKFASLQDAADYIGYTKTKRNDLIKKALAHYCEFEVLQDKSIIVVKAFDIIKPFRRYDYAYNIGDILSNKFGDFEVIDRFMDKPYKSSNHRGRIYKMKCHNDGNEFNLTEHEINRGYGCPVCGKKRVKPGQSLYDLRPDLLKYLANPEDAKNYTCGSNKKILCKCPDCGMEKYVMVSNLVKFGFSCSYCSDSISYPNKFIDNMLTQLGVKRIREASFDWMPRKLYDEYLPDYNTIIENNGAFHYMPDKQFTVSDKTLDDVIKNDECKKKTALSNGIRHYIELDCRLSDMDLIKQSVMNSDLPKIIGFSENDVDWAKCHEYACSSLMVKVWNDWNDGENIKSLADKYQLSDRSILTYVHNGEKCGKCKPLKNQRIENVKISGGNYADSLVKPLFCEEDGIYFRDKDNCQNYYQDLFPEKSGTYNLYTFINKNKPYKGKHFKYITQKEFNDMKTKALTDNSIVVIGNYFNKPKEEKDETW